MRARNTEFMTEADYAKQWGEWLSAALTARGWRQADLVRQSEGLIKRDRASKWVNGNERPSHRLAIVVSREDALEAAGYYEPTPELPAELEAMYAEQAAYHQTPAGIAQLEVEYQQHTVHEALNNFHTDEARRVLLAEMTDAELLAEIARRLAGPASVTDQAGNVPDSVDTQDDFDLVAKKRSVDRGEDIE